MSTQVIIVLISITLIIVESHHCGLNEASTLIHMTWTLFPNCNDPKIHDKFICERTCVCKKNYVRNAYGHCQPRRCPPNSSFKICTTIDDHQCIKATTNVHEPFVGDCVCHPGAKWFNEREGCKTLEQRLRAYSQFRWLRNG